MVSKRSKSGKERTTSNVIKTPLIPLPSPRPALSFTKPSLRMDKECGLNFILLLFKTRKPKPNLIGETGLV